MRSIILNLSRRRLTWQRHVSVIQTSQFQSAQASNFSVYGRSSLHRFAFQHGPVDVSRPGRRLYYRIAGVTPREMAEIEDQVWSVVGTSVKDPEIGVPLKDLGWMTRRLAVSKDGTIQLLLKIPTLLHPSLDLLKEQVKLGAESEIKQWLSEKRPAESNANVSVNVEAIATTPTPFAGGSAEDPSEVEARLGPGLAHVAHYVAVYSCKGGVGKSTVAVNLAYELARLGGRIGLLDLDVYGPSLPVLVNPDDPAVRQSPLGKGMVYPIEHRGVKMLSLGFVSSKSGVPGSGPGSEAAVLRGPMAGKVVTQLLKGTDWGPLDVLILDLPPGTGDVQLTVCQELELSGAVGVTTPSKLAIADARKGIQMFESLGVPTLAMVENMSYFECEGGGKHFPFGKGFADFIGDLEAADTRVQNVCQMPISSAANDANEEGVPLSLLRPSCATKELDALFQLARIVSKELFRLPYRPENSNGVVVFDDNQELFELASIQLNLDGEAFLLRAFSENGALQKRFAPKALRARDPKTGAVVETEQAPEEPLPSSRAGMVEIHRAGKIKNTGGKDLPERVEKKGKVGYEVVWGDGAKYIYSRRAIAMAAGATLVNG